MARGSGKAKGSAASRKSGAGRETAGTGRGNLRFRRALPGLTAFAAILVAVAILPFDVPGLPPGMNPLGPAGQWLRDWLVLGLGLGSVAAPLFLLVLAATLGQWWSPEWRKRGWLLSAGLVVLLPVTAYVLARPLVAETGCPPDARSAWTGLLGARAIGAPLCGWFGWLGTVLLAGLGWIVVSVLVFGFNPLTLAGSGIVVASKGMGHAARRVASAAGEAAASRRERRRQARERKRAEEEQKKAEARALAEQAAQDAALAREEAQADPTPPAAFA